jgi:hypothetical protein
MRLTWLIVGKDLYRLRWILLLWAVVLTGGATLATLQGDLTRETFFPFYIATLLVKLGFLPLFTVGLVMGLVHDDPVADSDAFWITRPITGRRLLSAKLLALILLWWVPVLVLLPWWLTRGFGLAQVMQATGQVLGLQAALSLLVLPLAVISPNGSRFVLNLMLVLAGLTGFFLASHLNGGGPAAAGSGAEPLSHTRTLALLWVLGGAGVAVHQFIFRRTRRSIAILAALAGVVAMVELVPARESTAARENAASQSASASVGGRESHGRLELGTEPGTTRSAGGTRIKVQERVLDPVTRVLAVTLAESRPRFAPDFGEGVLLAALSDSDPAYYYLSNTRDARVLSARIQPAGQSLQFASVGYSHWALAFNLGALGKNGSYADLEAWAKGATLVRTTSPDLAPRSAAPAGTTSASPPSAVTRSN